MNNVRDDYRIKPNTASKKWVVVSIIAIACLMVLAIIFGVTYSSLAKKSKANAEEYRTTMESMYQKSYYELCYNVDSLANTTNKLAVSENESMQQELLSDMTTYSTAAATSLSNLAEKRVEGSKMMKFINQTGDYCKYLNEKLARGEQLSAEDRNSLKNISDVIYTLEDSLVKIRETVSEDGFAFVDALANENSELSVMFQSWQDDTIDYPSMIYDGPFSDSMTERTAKALIGAEIDAANGEKIARSLIKEGTVKSVTVKEGSRNVFETYDYTMETTIGTAYVTIAKKGGSPISMVISQNQPQNLHLDIDGVEAKAEGYLTSLGLTDMKAVWVSNYNNVYFVNCAYTINGVIVYPDLIKVQINGETGAVVGMEALHYIFNHTTRTLSAPAISMEDAVGAISEEISVLSSRLTIVPTKGDNETLAWEIYGTKGEDKYFIYVNAISGNEMKIMRVVDSENGLLLQ